MLECLWWFNNGKKLRCRMGRRASAAIGAPRRKHCRTGAQPSSEDIGLLCGNAPLRQSHYIGGLRDVKSTAGGVACCCRRATWPPLSSRGSRVIVPVRMRESNMVGWVELAAQLGDLEACDPRFEVCARTSGDRKIRPSSPRDVQPAQRSVQMTGGSTLAALSVTLDRHSSGDMRLPHPREDKYGPQPDP